MFKQCHFDVKRMKEKNIGLTDILNSDDTEDFLNLSLTDSDMNDILESGQYATV